MLFSYVLLCPLGANAALKLKGTASIEESWNPTPAEGDIILPMPCDLGMVFKLVAVPAQGFLWDMTTRFGHDDANAAERAYYDSRYTTSLSGPFGIEDLPSTWHKYVPTGNYYYYLIGKYEISGLQWKAVMESMCPSPTAEDAQPKTDISWYDAVQFSEVYTTWLLQKHPESLPHYAKDKRNVGFLRLPTEAEWEYAARGGHTSSSQEMREQNFFSMEDGTSYTDYVVFRAEDATRIEEHPSRIGSRKPNPLGIYDTSGNVAEMVIDVFRFSLGGRLHGSAGGFVRKGGSYLSGTDEMLPGRREETAFFFEDGPMHSRDLGFRLVISGINTPGGDRPDVLHSEWLRAGEKGSPLLDGTGNPLEELDRLLASARTDAERENYRRLRSIIKDNNIALEREQMLAAESEVRTAAFMMETVRNFSVRCRVASIQLTNIEKEKKTNTKKSAVAIYDEYIATAKRTIAIQTRGLEQSLRFYKAKLDDTVNFIPEILDAAVHKVMHDIGVKDDFNKKLHDNIQLFAQHVQAVRAKNFKALTEKQLLHDIIPPKK